ncbi:PREDICTED: uncharacterized protein LOC108361825 [Rhagoletis zephyria]|uniref:uncharacterized protein LOC108361825 n=1 Tax=Rhagoletis zephyria TaxID=28612 RepID=UPI0008116DB5|nr:PREDICTED: uncharacterized protein LOC108361825 [Rhagoletis zephyria]
MYRCVRVAAPDNMQCILWPNSPEDEFSVYKPDTVTYGTKPAAFLAIRAMHQLASDESSFYPLGAQIVMRDFYVDNLISGGNTVEEVLEIKHQSTSLLARGNFRLQKWCSNNQEVLSDIPDAYRESFLKFDDGSNITKALGLVWDPLKDSFLFAFTSRIAPGRNSKRSALSTIARCYDPLGLIGPTLTKANIIRQRMRRDKLEWDESLPQSLDTAWSAFCKDFVDVHHLSFPRYIGATQEVHAFCDASLEACGACIYARLIKDGHIQVHLLCSKARLAPLKTLTVPKLELCAADLLAHLLAEIAKMKAFDCSFYCWSDSTVSWLMEISSKFNVFIRSYSREPSGYFVYLRQLSCHVQRFGPTVHHSCSSSRPKNKKKILPFSAEEKIILIAVRPNLNMSDDNTVEDIDDDEEDSDVDSETGGDSESDGTDSE